MTNSNRTIPIESFGPEMLAALTRGSREKIEITLPSYNAAVRFRLRAHQLRAQMRLQGHELANVVQRATIRIDWDHSDDKTGYNNTKTPHDRNTPAIVTIMPKDSEFADALIKAGINKAELGEDPLTDIAATQSEPVADYLSQFTKPNKVLGG